MKNKKKIIAVVSIFILFSSPFAYAQIGKKILYSRTYEHLTIIKGYKKEEFKISNARHSFINRILSYPEWGIDVVFKDEPTEIYIYRYEPESNKIIQCGGVDGKHYEKD